jgi:hypothetical protein
MARIIRMPPLSELPRGARRDFVEELRQYYRAADRPPLREVSRRIEGRPDLKEVTASQETVRRILRGMVIPTDWNRVNAIFQVFCELSETEPDSDRWEDTSYGDVQTKREHLRQLWDQALEEDPARPSSPRPADDPWASDEPPF